MFVLCVIVCAFVFCMLHGCISYHMFVDYRCVLLSCVGVCCACVHVLRVIACAVAFVYCNVAFHITRACTLHVCFAFVI